MSSPVEITPWHWAGFILLVLGGVAVDMGAFRSRPRSVSFREALLWTTGWAALAAAFAVLLGCWLGRGPATEFSAGYLLELSLSLDNLLVIALIFSAFRIPVELQRRVLVWGLWGALTLRGLLIATGAGLVNRFQWILYLFGAFLLFTGIRILFGREPRPDPEKNPLLRLTRRFYPVAPGLDGQKFLTRWQGRTALTPLALVLLAVESSDLIFALDSVPAVFSVTRNTFILFSSNALAIIGLRSLYFLLASAMDRFRFLPAGIALVLGFVGTKMLLDPHDAPPRWFQCVIPASTSLFVIVGIIAGAIFLSLLRPRPNRSAAP